MTKEAVTYRQEKNVKRNDFLQLLIQLKEKAEDVNNSKDKSVPWYKSKYDPIFWLLFALRFTVPHHIGLIKHEAESFVRCQQSLS
jgi:hypothetical protein